MTNPGGPNPVTYARLVKAAVEAARARNPRARFLIQADTTGQPTDGPPVDWVDAMFAAVPDLARWFDGVAVHPYATGASPDEYTPSGDTRGQFRRIEQIHDRFAAHGAGAKPFWLTEIGWATCPERPPCVNEQQQADYIQRMLEIVRGYSWVQAVLIYNYRDDQRAADSPTNMNKWYGLLRSDGRAKPAWKVLQRAMR
jgi:exo-beta-1,3-glucanase (GH17 family)